MSTDTGRNSLPLVVRALLADLSNGPKGWNERLRILAGSDLLVDGATVTLCRLDLEGGLREVLASIGPHAHELKTERLGPACHLGPSAKAIARWRTGGPLTAEKGRPSTSAMQFLGTVLPAPLAQPLLVFPLLNGGEMIGAFWMEGYDPKAFPPEKAQTLPVVARCLALGLAASLRRRQGEEMDSVLKEALEAQERERERIALDVHDGAIQMLASAFQHVQAARDSRRLDEESSRTALAKSSTLLRETMHELRGLMESLRPATLDRFGLIASIESDVLELSQSGWDAGLTADAIKLSRGIETTLYRVVHEALTNVKNHAGTCPVRVSIKKDKRWLRVEVRDWGRGFDAASLPSPGRGHTFGLLSMRKRAELLGATFHIESRPGEGTRINLDLPLRRKGD